MKIKFKLFATLMRHLPKEAKGHELDMDVAETTSTFNIIDQFGIDRVEAHLVLVNGVYLNEQQRELPLQEGDTLAIWPPVAGG